MKKLLLALLLIFSVGFSLDISAVISPNLISLEKGKGATFDLTITNNGGAGESLGVILTGVPTWMRISSSDVYVPSKDSQTLHLYFSDTAGPSSYIYFIEIHKTETHEKVWEGSLIIKVIDPDAVVPGEEPRSLKINSVETVSPGSNIIVTLEVSESLVPSEAEIILLQGDKEVAKVTGAIDRLQKSFTMNIPETQTKGDYVLRAYLTGKAISNQTSLEITELSKVEVTTNTEKKLLGRTVAFTARNVGNTVKSDVVTARIGLLDRPLLDASNEPTIIRDGLSYILSWEYTLAPGEEKTIGSYSVDYIPYSIIFALFVIALLLLLQRPEALEVKKQVEQLQGEDSTKFKVKISVTNCSDEPVEEATLEDIVPRIAQVTKAYIVKPDARKVREGTILSWALGKLEPGEERIIAYETVLGFGIVGNFELPKPKIVWKK